MSFGLCSRSGGDAREAMTVGCKPTNHPHSKRIDLKIAGCLPRPGSFARATRGHGVAEKAYLSALQPRAQRGARRKHLVR